MVDKIKPFILDIQALTFEYIFEVWNWRLKGMKKILIVSKWGDLFLLGDDGFVYWLAVDSGGGLSKIAADENEFISLLNSDTHIENWFMASWIERLEKAGIFLQADQVYNHKKLPVLGGEYANNNIEALDIKIAIPLASEISRQIKDLPDGTKVKIVAED